VVLGVLVPFVAGPLASLLAGALRIRVGVNTVLLAVLLAISTIVVGIIAFRRGERSWMALLAFIGAAIVGAFWIVFVLGEILLPH
jgi:hypothetical protein